MAREFLTYDPAGTPATTLDAREHEGVGEVALLRFGRVQLRTLPGGDGDHNATMVLAAGLRALTEDGDLLSGHVLGEAPNVEDLGEPSRTDGGVVSGLVAKPAETLGGEVAVEGVLFMKVNQSLVRGLPQVDGEQEAVRGKERERGVANEQVGVGLKPIEGLLRRRHMCAARVSWRVPKNLADEHARRESKQGRRQGLE